MYRRTKEGAASTNDSLRIADFFHPVLRFVHPAVHRETRGRQKHNIVDVRRVWERRKSKVEGKMIDLPLLGDMGEQTSGGSLSANFASLSQVRGSSAGEPCVPPAVVVSETMKTLLLLLCCGGCMQAAGRAFSSCS